MTKFEELGIAKQEQAYCLSFAQKQFDYSCETCCAKGLRHGSCASCPISVAHNRATQEIMSGERKRPAYHKSVDRKGHITLVVHIEKEVDTEIKVVIK